MKWEAVTAKLVLVTELQHIAESVGYRLTRVIAEGGMGCVYEAEQEGVDGFRKRVAIKIIREEYSAIEEFRKNFIGEAKLVADLIHANIVQTYHLGESAGRYFMVMEYVNGVNLEEFLLQHMALGKNVPVEIACFIISRICRGLGYAHARADRNGQPLNIVHRDVNPRNIMLSSEGDVKLTDFGIAKAIDLMYNIEGEVIAGKDEYLSPEQARREVTDNRADLFSCGVVLSELICRKNIFETDSAEGTRGNILHLPIPDFGTIRPGLDDRVNQILHRALARERNRRYPMAEDMMLDIELFLYADGYGPTHEKLARYLQDLFRDGFAFEDELRHSRSAWPVSKPAALKSAPPSPR